ncbi:TetR/AcrR family transcriptional regulator [Nocardia colli]|uniref:TetR/AcrR family transcriptional regulator n=1 Tax=Nocardia colli TaxID=2545717 RepID=UPI0035D9BDCA
MLSTELIVQTCRRLIGIHGVDGVSVRRLGAALGADATSIYRYFRTKDDLLLAVTEESIGRTMRHFRRTGDWRDDLRRYADLVYRVNLADPQVATLAATRVTGKPNEIASVEVVLGILRGAGFGRADAVRHFHSYIDLVLAFSALGAALALLADAEAEANRRVWRDVYTSLPQSQYPNIHALTPQLNMQLPRKSFADALELFLLGLQQQLASAQRAARTGGARKRATGW